MTDFDYSRIQQTALRLLQRYGQDCTLTTTQRDGSTNVRTVRMVEINTVKHVFADTNVQIGDRHILLASAGTPHVWEPKPGDILARSTQGVLEQWMVVDPVSPIKPASVIIAYTCYIRLSP